LKQRGATGLNDSWELPPEDMKIPIAWVGKKQYGSRKNEVIQDLIGYEREIVSCLPQGGSRKGERVDSP
jgi:hypothetical protein